MCFDEIDQPEDPIRDVSPTRTTRRGLLQALAGLGIGSVAFQRALAQEVAQQGTVSVDMIRSAQWVADMELTEEQQAEVAKELSKMMRGQKALQEFPIDADVGPAFAFVPHFIANPPQVTMEERQKTYRAKPNQPKELPRDIDDPELPFASIAQLGKGLREKRWTSLQLTQLYLNRLERYDPVLRCVIERLDSLAKEQAVRADKELSEGKDRGPLHGIPWGAKDIIAVPPYRTTWGAPPYRDQIRPNAATVYERLEQAGAVLLAKLSVGTLAWGEIWHDATTKNPWNVTEGSSGSSAGSAAATVSGLCGFSLGSETLGSIVSPTQRCRVTGLRPTFGRVSRYGCMALAWTFDKIGPICRHVEDCSLVFAAIAGGDGKDPSVHDHPFQWPLEKPPAKWRVGYIENQLSPNEKSVMEKLEGMNCEMVRIRYGGKVPEGALLDALSAEASCMHEDLIRSKPSEKDMGKWGPTFRESQWIRAIHYLRGMRARTLLIEQTEQVLKTVDVVLGGNDLGRMNLTGHPSLVVGCGSEPNGVGDAPGTIKLTARMFGDDLLLAFGEMIQRELPPTPRQPPLQKWLDEKAAGQGSSEGKPS